jgi:hypothetical protein
MVGSVLQSLIVLNNLDTYIYQSWHGTLLTIAVILFASMFNTLLAVRLPMIEGVLLILHLAGLFAIVIPLWVLAPRGNVKDTILTFTTTAGWPDVSLASLIGMVSVIAVLVGYDCTVHMCKSKIMNSSQLHPYSCVAIRGRADANRTCLYLPCCCITLPRRGAGVHGACMHPSRTLYANAALVAPSTHPPRRQRRQTLQPIAQQRQRQRQRLPTARRCHGQKGEYISATVPPHLRAAHIFAIQTTI